MKFILVLALFIAFTAVISAQDSNSIEDDWDVPAIRYGYRYNVRDPKSGSLRGGWITGGPGQLGLGYYSGIRPRFGSGRPGLYANSGSYGGRYGRYRGNYF
ncbi:uncharacterized protein LOC129793434 [Lutzomyia longipalpis]|uniref:uncharacterized protein LOC129793434 n=1 Tax=Lutzomyia longipalpis TaxID=7200 RepID=UPI002483D621|nr:uncharacterized protein LOC129793434 [Lutzomyia longipalpis]